MTWNARVRAYRQVMSRAIFRQLCIARNVTGGSAMPHAEDDDALLLLDGQHPSNRSLSKFVEVLHRRSGIFG